MKDRIRQGGYIFTLTKATKQFDCVACCDPIQCGEEYLKVERGGGGLGWAVRPDRIHNHQADIDSYLAKDAFKV